MKKIIKKIHNTIYENKNKKLKKIIKKFIIQSMKTKTKKLKNN